MWYCCKQCGKQLLMPLQNLQTMFVEKRVQLLVNQRDQNSTQKENDHLKFHLYALLDITPGFSC